MVLRNSSIIYWKQNIQSISWQELTLVLKSIKNYREDLIEDQFYQFNHEDYKVSYIYKKSKGLTFIFLNNLKDDDNTIDQLIRYMIEEFLRYYQDDIIENVESLEKFRSFDAVTHLIHGYFKPNIALVGFKNVGKTTIAHLICEDEKNIQQDLTLKKNIYPLKIKDLEFNLWDFSGEVHLLFLWPKYLKDSDAMLIITDSSPKIVEKSRFFVDLIKRDFQDSKYGLIANKQDLPKSVRLEKIIKMFSDLKVYGLTALNQSDREKIISIIVDILQIKNELSPRVQIMLEREKLADDAEKSLAEGNLERALADYEIMAEYSRKLGEHELVQELLDKIAIFKKEIDASQREAAELEIKTNTESITIEDSVEESIEDEQLSEIDMLREKIDFWKDRIEEIERKLEHLDLKFMSRMIDEKSYEAEKEKLKSKKADLENKLFDARFKMIKLL